DVLVLEEETVAGRAPADALAGQARLTVDPELAVRRAGGDDQRLRAVDSAVVEGDGLDRSSICRSTAPSGGDWARKRSCCSCTAGHSWGPGIPTAKPG